MGKTTGTSGGTANLKKQHGGMSTNGVNAGATLAPLLKRGQKERFAVELMIGPGEAEFLLANNESNRNIRPTKVAQFVKDMRHGRWHENGESIIVARTGELNDGQHRLRAIYITKLPQKLLVAFGYERETRHTIDSGVARTVGEQLQMSGMHYGTQSAATARLIISYEQSGGRLIGRTSGVTSLEQQDRVHKDDLLREIVAYCDRHRAPFVRTALVAASFYILSRISPTHARTYIDGILTGTNLTQSDPAYLVRDRLMRAWTDKKMSSKRLTDGEVLEIIFRGWNYYATGKTTASKLLINGTLPVLKVPAESNSKSAVDQRKLENEVAEITPQESIVPYEMEAA